MLTLFMVSEEFCSWLLPIVEVAMTEPLAFRERSLPFVRPVMAKLEVVAWEPVAFTKVKFWRVEEPVTKRLERVVSPEVTVRVPVRLAALLIV